MPTQLDKALNSKVRPKLLHKKLLYHIHFGKWSISFQVFTWNCHLSSPEMLFLHVSILSICYLLQLLTRVQNTFLAFTGIVTAVAAWSIWGQDLFPKEADPTGGTSSLIWKFTKSYSHTNSDPETWTREELRRWLAAVSIGGDIKRSY
jgi:hypothetical protein